MLPNLAESELSGLDGLVDEPQEAVDEPPETVDQLAFGEVGAASDIEATDQDERGHGPLEAAPLANLDLLASVDNALSVLLSHDLAIESGASFSDLIRIRELSLAAQSDEGRGAS